MTVIPVDSTGSESPAAALPAFAWRGALSIAAVVAAAHAVVATRYGWHRDEFYYVVAGRHLAWGYVDQPPLTPVLARLASAVAGGVLPLRLVVIAVQAATIVLGALIAREVGGGRGAQALAAGCVAGCAVVVGAALFLGTTPVDQFFWALVIWCVLRALRTGNTRAWVAAGIAAGFGLENKHTVAVLLAGVFVGLLLRRRDALRTSGPWIAAAIAAFVWAPNLWWDATHHWETLDMARVLADKQGGVGGSIAQLPLLLVLFPGPLILFVLIRGIRWTGRDESGRTHSWLLVASAFVVVTFTLAGGKPYYSAPVFVPLFAFGAVATERRALAARRRSTRVPALVAASVVAASAVSLPYFPPPFASAIRSASKEPMETYGWPALAAQVAHAAAADPAANAVYVSNYGEAGALTTYGRGVGLALPVVAGQNAYRDWGPPTGTPTDVIAVGEFDRAFLLQAWGKVEQIAFVTLPHGLHNEETANQAAIFRCRQPKGTWKRLWPTLSYLS